MAIYLIVLKSKISVLEKHVKKYSSNMDRIYYKIFHLIHAPMLTLVCSQNNIHMLTVSKVYFGTNKQMCRWGELCK
jgi:uncharacterized protein (UPF0332 family)